MSPLSQSGGAPDGPQAPVSRVVLLGASNLTMGIGTVLATARRCWDGPLEVFAALGHGRSFGRASRVLGRQLPGILECGLWEALAASPERPTAALVTDIGNDILYEEPVEQISRWLEACFDRLTVLRGTVVVTQLPLDNLRLLSRARYMLLRSVMVPGCRLSLEAVSERVHAVNEIVQRLAIERQFPLVPQRAEWYGFDVLHIRWAQRRRAWGTILHPWTTAPDVAHAPRVALSHTWYLQSRTPHQRRLWGLEQRAPQPSVRFGDGTLVSIY
jgi:hypothetical protein